MLLARLVEYATGSLREGSAVPPPYYKAQLIRWILELNADGSLASSHLQPLANPDDPVHRNGVEHVVPSITKTSGIAPQIAVGTPEYMFGWVASDGKPDRVNRAHQAFCELTADWVAADPSGPAPALQRFLSGDDLQRLARPDKWARGDLVIVRIQGLPPVFLHETGSAQEYWAHVAASRKESGTTGLCVGRRSF